MEQKIFIEQKKFASSPAKQKTNPYIQQIQTLKPWVFSFQEPPPQNWEKIFAKKAPLALDLGCGAGNFLTHAAELRSDYQWLGMDVRYKRLVKATLKARKKGLENFRFIQDKVEKINHWFPSESLAFCSIQFPDPWPKKKQQKNRFLTVPFAKNLFQSLEKGACVFVKSDHEEYGHFAFENFLSTHLWEVVVPILSSHKEPMPDFQNFLISNPFLGEPAEKKEALPLKKFWTEFEAMFCHEGLPIYFFCLRRPK